MKKVIATQNAPAAIGPYSQAIEVNGMIFLSGQLPIDPATGDFVPGGVKEQTEQCFKNIKAVIESIDHVMSDVVRITVFVKDIKDVDVVDDTLAHLLMKQRVFGDVQAAF